MAKLEWMPNEPYEGESAGEYQNRQRGRSAVDSRLLSHDNAIVALQALTERLSARIERLERLETTVAESANARVGGGWE